MSYNKIIRLLEDFSSAHLQINSFGEGFKPDINNFITNNNQGFYLYAEPYRVELGSNINKFTIRLYSFDIKQKDNSNTRDVLSDTAQILSDVYKYFGYNFEQLDSWSMLNTSLVLNPLNNFNADLTVGWYADIIIEVGVTVGDCDIPIVGVNPPPEYYCSPVTILDKDGNVITEVDSGGSYVCISDIIITVNGKPYIIANDDVDIPVLNSDNNSVGTINGNNIVIPDSQISVNSSIVESLPATDNFNLDVQVDGTPQGTYDAMTNTWNIVGEKDLTIIIAYKETTTQATITISGVSGTLSTLTTTLTINDIKKNGTIVTLPISIVNNDVLEFNYNTAPSIGDIVLGGQYV